LRQRLFIDPTGDLLPSRSNDASNNSYRRSIYDTFEAPLAPGSPHNAISGFGDEQSTMINSTARWGDSQGIISSPERVSVPHLAIGLGYNAAGELGAAEDGSAAKDDNGGFAKMMDQLLTSATTPVLPSTLVRGIAPIGGFDFLTSLDLLIPRPSWGHEEAEGYALGMILRRITGLQKLCLHADGGGAAAGSSGHNDFGLMRKPPYGNPIVGDGESSAESSDIGELDMVVSENGAVTYPSHGHGHPHPPNHANTHVHGPAHGRTSIAPTSSMTSPAGGVGHVTITGGAQEHRHRGYGPETWWAGVLCALSGWNDRDKSTSVLVKSSNDESQGEDGNGAEDDEEGSDEDSKGSSNYTTSPVPPIRALRISVSIPGHVQPQDFDAFYHLILPHLQAFERLEILVFDMAFAVIPTEGTFAYAGMVGIGGNAERYPSPGRYSSPGKYTAPGPNERSFWKEQDNKTNWLLDVASGGLGDLRRHLKRQRYYVESLIDPSVPASEENPAEARKKAGHGHGNLPGHNQVGPGQAASIPLRHGHPYREVKDKDLEAPTMVKRHSEPGSLFTVFLSLSIWYTISEEMITNVFSDMSEPSHSFPFHHA
jgi:hypothetical protein